MTLITIPIIQITTRVACCNGFKENKISFATAGRDCDHHSDPFLRLLQKDSLYRHESARPQDLGLWFGRRTEIFPEKPEQNISRNDLCMFTVARR